MSEVFLGRGAKRQPLALGRLLGEGAAGKVHALPGMPGTAAKLYHGIAQAKWHEAKIDAMLANPPELPHAAHAGILYPQIAWPQAKLYDASGRFVGFTMPEIDFGRSTSLVNLLQKNSRRIENLSDYYGYRVLVARNLASVFAELHRAGHHMIDMKPANLRFYPAVSWMAVVDTDGFSIAGSASGTRGRIAATQLSDEYIAPESWQREPAELGVGQDLFALAVIIFQLLNNGVHPFAGTAMGGKGATDLQTRILDGIYPYALRPRTGLIPSTASVHRMFRRGTRVMFDSAFLPGGNRPTAEEWRDHLDVLLGQLVPCNTRPGEHVHFGAGCGFCAHEARVEAARAAPRRDPVPPRPRAGARGQPPRRAVPASRPAPVPKGRQLALVRPAASRRSRTSGLFGATVLVGAALLALATQQSWTPLVQAAPGGARTADLADVAKIESSAPIDIVQFAEPRDYLVVPDRGGLSVAMRTAPGNDKPVADMLALHEAVIGRGIKQDTRGVSWIWVTRASDGTTGFVQRNALARPNAQPVDCGKAEPCADGFSPADVALDTRYRRLLVAAEGSDRAWLIEGRKLWGEQRESCNNAPEPLSCRKAVNARWMSELDNWTDSQQFGKRAGEPVLTPAVFPVR